MSDLYFTCDWTIRPAVNYVRLVGIARELDCELAVIHANYVTPDRRVLMRFALRVPSQAAFDEFLEKVGHAIGLTGWQSSSSAVYELAQPLDLHLMDADLLTRWMDAMHAYGLHNQSLQEGE